MISSGHVDVTLRSSAGGVQLPDFTTPVVGTHLSSCDDTRRPMFSHMPARQPRLRRVNLRAPKSEARWLTPHRPTRAQVPLPDLSSREQIADVMEIYIFLFESQSLSYILGDVCSA